MSCEALTNAVKHAHAQSADVVVTLDGTELQVSVSDDGHGWPDDAGSPQLPDLADRLAALGGRLDVRSSAGGTTVTAGIPVADPPPPNQSGALSQPRPPRRARCPPAEMMPDDACRS